MKLLYLSKENLENSIFIKEFVFHYKFDGKSILVHDHFGSVDDTRFVTKRISALMSEEMIVNNAFSGDQRNLLFQGEESLEFRDELVQSAFATIQVFILNPVAGSAQGAFPVTPLEALQTIRAKMDIDEVVLFPRNSLSPLAVRRELIAEADAVDPLIRIYDEETELLEMARALAPVALAAPKNMVGEPA